VANKNLLHGSIQIGILRLRTTLFIYEENFFKKPIRKPGKRGNNLVQENIERKKFRLFYKVTLGFL